MQPVVLRGDDLEITVLPGAGARLHSLRVRGNELLRSPSDIEVYSREPFFWGGYVMAPWCNRVVAGPVVVGNRTISLASNFPDGSAIHGQVYDVPWQQAGPGTFEIEHDGDGWPWRYGVAVEYRLDGRRLAITLTLRNLSDEPMPGGVGLHPWFPTPVQVRIDSALTYGSNNESLAEPIAVTGDLDLRRRQAMPARVDAAWADPGDPPVELWWPAYGLRASLRAPASALCIVAADAPERGAIAVEPQTHAPQGLRRLLNGEPGALTVLQPGQELVLPITIDFEW
jgi:aldose 1-epimerase